MRTPLIAIALVMGAGMGPVQAQQLLNYLPNTTTLSSSQKHYLDEATSWPVTGDWYLATVGFDLLGGSTVNFNLPQGLVLPAHRVERNNIASDGTRRAWIGEFPGAAGNAHLVYKSDDLELVAHVQFEDVAFMVRPLGGGLHAVLEIDLSMEEGCMTTDENATGSGIGRDGLETYVDLSNTDVQESLVETRSMRATGECSVRVLVAYTAATAAAVTDILSDIINMTNTANTGYANSNIAYQIELAGAYQIVYTGSGDIEVDRDRFRATSDGFMDDIHTQRTLWEADQCMLLTSYGTGIAYISTAFADQFSVTGVPNFGAFTYHHELGHCNECTHATNQPPASAGVAPYAGWGEPTTSCFRTVMAYASACPSGSCPRHNIFSDNDVDSWTCGGTLYTPGTSNARNQDRLVLSYPTIVGHNTVGVNTLYSGDYDWLDNEAIHFAASSTLTYSSGTNNFELRSGSEGSFRATDSVTLGEGFWARSGTDFRAYLDDCN